MPRHTPLRPLPTLPALFLNQLAYHVRVLLRTPRAVIGGMSLPILLLILRSDGAHATFTTHTHLTAGLAAFGVLSTAYITHASSLVAARQAGVLKRWRAAPLPTWCYFAGRIAATTLLAVAGGVLTAFVGTTDYNLEPSLASIAQLGLVLVLGAATWASIGTVASALIPTVEAAWPLLGLTYLPVVILSGSFGTVSAEPGWLAQVMTYLPVQPIIDSAARALGTGASAWVISARDLVVLAAWAVAGMLLSQRCFRWMPRAPGHRRPKPLRSRTRRSPRTPPVGATVHKSESESVAH
jgi:ABC-2 type transport system permease protein